MVGARNALGRNDLTGESAKAALHSVAHYGSADLLRYREADAHRRIRILAVADEQDETGCGCAESRVRREEIGALADSG
jgi:hypothetical protein